jgi:hypothetical protein
METLPPTEQERLRALATRYIDMVLAKKHIEEAWILRRINDRAASIIQTAHLRRLRRMHERRNFIQRQRQRQHMVRHKHSYNLRKRKVVKHF